MTTSSDTADLVIPDLIVIGSGIAGLAAAQAAMSAGMSVMVIDKGRRIGGRVSTRRAHGFTFNHGAQFMTARSPEFVSLSTAAIQNHALAEWHVANRDALCGIPTMRDFPVYMQRGLDVRQGIEITDIGREHDHIILTDKDGQTHMARHLIVSAPAPQSQRLLADVATNLCALAGSASYAPCWTGMYGFSDAPPPHDSAPVGDDAGPVGFALWEADRPGALAANHALTVQAAPGWSQQHLEDDAGDVADALLAAWQEASGQTIGTPVLKAAHRWRYARVVASASDDAAVTSSCGRIAVAGDWLGGARIEHAFLSGQRAVAALITAPN